MAEARFGFHVETGSDLEAEFAVEQEAERQPAAAPVIEDENRRGGSLRPILTEADLRTNLRQAREQPQHFCVYQGFAIFPHDIKEPIGFATVQRERGSVVGPRQAHPQQSMFPATVLDTLDPGPRVADENLEDLHVGLDICSDKLVSFSNLDLMAMLFPELFPYEDGDSNGDDDNNNDNEADGRENEPAMTIRACAKYRLLHFDRRFARNLRVMMFM
ncbi:hypothetical protein EDD21DRAFT_420487 [Dissophora ornata]|nr:hypothetical protein EDD21DRAFT_420487 [Dissophora ornata]